AWGRWIGPVSITGNACEGVTCNENYSENQGFHYVVGMPTMVMPTIGTATYSVLGATRPTYADGSTAPGTFSGSLPVQFGADGPNFHSVSGSFSVAMPDRTYSWSASSGTSNAYFALFASNTAISGCANPGFNCRADVSGFFAGTNAERAAAAYRI